MGSGYEPRALRDTQGREAAAQRGEAERSKSGRPPHGAGAPSGSEPNGTPTPTLLQSSVRLPVERHVGPQALEARLADPLHVAEIVQRLEAAALLAQLDDGA